jgi:hypothetical protein
MGTQRDPTRPATDEDWTLAVDLFVLGRLRPAPFRRGSTSDGGNLSIQLRGPSNGGTPALVKRLLDAHGGRQWSSESRSHQPRVGWVISGELLQGFLHGLQAALIGAQHQDEAERVARIIEVEHRRRSIGARGDVLNEVRSVCAAEARIRRARKGEHKEQAVLEALRAELVGALLDRTEKGVLRIPILRG